MCCGKSIACLHSQVIGTVTTTIGYYDYKTTAHIDHALFFAFSNTKVDFRYGACSADASLDRFMVLNGVSPGNETVQFDTEIYAMVRESVRKQLGEESGKWTERIDI